MKTKKDYEDIWQKACFSQDMTYKHISGKPIQGKKTNYAREICLTIHHRVQGSENVQSTSSSVKADATDANKKKIEKELKLDKNKNKATEN